MANKSFLIGGDLPITIYKRRGSRNLRLSIGPAGQARVSIPTWVPYKAGLAFAESRQGWIRAQQRPTTVLIAGRPVGKAHRLEFESVPLAAKISSRVQGTRVIVRYPEGLTPNSPPVQAVATAACVRALRGQANQLLPQRLAHLAELHGYKYKSVAIKQLKGRWGSCDQSGHIILNLYLMQLPWELIDYVLLHELTHTKILRHGPDFWTALSSAMPAAHSLRKTIKGHQPVLDS